MTLQSSGAISLSDVNVELGRSATASINMNEAAVRTLAGKASGAISMSDFYGKSNFTPTTITRTSGTAATETVPTGATSVRIRVGGGGGSGGVGSEFGDAGGGGGGGGWCERTIAVVGGNTLTYTVGAAAETRADIGQGATGNASTVSGTVSGGSVSMTANGGGGGLAGGSGGAGGTASGGTTNTTGGTGTAGGDGAGGGAGGGDQSGDGGNGGNEPFGTVFGGERGEIEFHYT